MTKENQQHKELLVLYKNTHKEIVQIKAMSWKFICAHSILSIFFIYIITHLKSRCCLSDGLAVFTFFALIMSIIATFFVCYISGSSLDQLKSKRSLLAKINKNFSLEFNSLVEKSHSHYLEFGDIIMLLISILIPVFFMSLLVISSMI